MMFNESLKQNSNPECQNCVVQVCVVHRSLKLETHQSSIIQPRTPNIQYTSNILVKVQVLK